MASAKLSYYLFIVGVVKFAHEGDFYVYRFGFVGNFFDVPTVERLIDLMLNQIMFK